MIKQVLANGNDSAMIMDNDGKDEDPFVKEEGRTNNSGMRRTRLEHDGMLL